MAFTVTSITPSQVKSHLSGLDSWLIAASKSMATVDDNYIANTIVPQAVASFQSETNFLLDRSQVCSFPDGIYAPSVAVGAEGLFGLSDQVVDDPNNPGNTIPYIPEAPYTYWVDDAYQFFKVRLNHRPVLQVQRLRLMWNENDIVWTAPAEWLRWHAETGDFWLLPVRGAATISSAALSFSMVNATYGLHGEIPGIISIDYIAGLPTNWQQQRRWQHIEEALEQMAALRLLNRISEVYDAGLQGASMSASPIGESLNFERFMRRKQELQASIDLFKQNFIAQYTPIDVGFV